MSQFRAIVISGRAAVGTSTLAKKLKETLGWEYVNAGQIQRQYDQKHKVNENAHGAEIRPDEHEKEIDAMTKDMLSSKSNIIYEGWLAGYMARGIPDVLKVLVVCPDDEIRAQRVSKRDRVDIEAARKWITQRESENIVKWKKLYGDHDFWDPALFDIVIDTSNSDIQQTRQLVLDKLGEDR